MNKIRISDSGCWDWTGTIQSAGYGMTTLHGRRMLSHRASLTIWAPGMSLDGLQVDHLCRNKTCVNPWHLEPVTQAENLRRQGEAVTHCPSGHEYTPENTYRSPKQPNCRRCRTCARERQLKGGRA
ncbi:HNH endonuclease [Microtetraspora sp. AC03309]|nr:HNH endonuclease [Microtetraspora sp. AC03309]